MTEKLEGNDKGEREGRVKRPEEDKKGANEPKKLAAQEETEGKQSEKKDVIERAPDVERTPDIVERQPDIKGGPGDVERPPDVNVPRSARRNSSLNVVPEKEGKSSHHVKSSPSC